MTSTKRTDRRRGVAAIALGLGASALTIAAVTTGALGSFNATLTNDTNTTGTGTLVMQEIDTTGTTTCDSAKVSADTNTATCATNLYGGNTIAPSTTATTTTTTIKNAGTTTAAALTATAGTCTKTANGTITGTGNLCDALHITITANGTTIYTGTATTLAGKTLNLTTTATTPGTTVKLDVTTALDTNAGNTLQGQTATQPLTLTFTA